MSPRTSRRKSVLKSGGQAPAGLLTARLCACSMLRSALHPGSTMHMRRRALAARTQPSDRTGMHACVRRRPQPIYEGPAPQSATITTIHVTTAQWIGGRTPAAFQHPSALEPSPPAHAYLGPPVTLHFLGKGQGKWRRTGVGDAQPARQPHGSYTAATRQHPGGSAALPWIGPIGGPTSSLQHPAALHRPSDACPTVK
jgi:hypothetical protein